ncbi:hypothetical protein PM082_016974 [Marasmius tenuissimus]|nr:hypothetical protein PM082_016974 [Marasmius tenuissimus]
MKGSTAKNMAQSHSRCGATASKVATGSLRRRFLAEYTKEVTEEDLKRWNEELRCKGEGMACERCKKMDLGCCQPSSQTITCLQCVQGGLKTVGLCTRVAIERAARIQRVLDIDAEIYEELVQVHAKPLESLISSGNRGWSLPRGISSYSSTHRQVSATSLSTTSSESVPLESDGLSPVPVDFDTTSSLPNQIDEPDIPSSEVAALQRTNADLEETVKNLTEQLEAQRADQADVQARLDAEINRTSELDQECEELWQNEYHWCRLRGRSEEKLRGRDEDKRKVGELELMLNELNGINQAHQEYIKAKDDELEDLKRVNKHLKGELEGYYRSQLEFEKKAEIARTDLETFMDEQSKVQAALMDQRDRVRAERDDIMANFEYCMRERDTIKAKLEVERARSTHSQQELAEVHEALYIADLKTRSEYARRLSEQAALRFQSIAKDQEATILSLQEAIACLADSSLQASASGSRLASPSSSPRSDSTVGSALGKRKRVSSRPSSPDQHVTASNGAQNLSPLFTPAEIEYKGKADLGTRPRIPSVQSRRAHTAANSCQETRKSTGMESMSPLAPPGTCSTSTGSLTDEDNGPKSNLSGGLGLLQSIGRRSST